MLIPKTIDADHVKRLIADDAWCMQPKVDGVRCQVHVVGGNVTTYGRTGNTVHIPHELVADLPRGFDYVLDAEWAWDVLWVWDNLQNPDRPYWLRFTTAAEIVGAVNRPDVRKVQCWRTEKAKARAFEIGKRQRIEGFVFRRLEARYEPISCADLACRFKFRFRCEVVVMDMVPGKRSFQCGMYDQHGDLIPVGGVPVSGKNQYTYAWGKYQGAGPCAMVAEVEALYVTDRGQLFQPKFVRFRPEKNPCPEDCPISQLDGLEPHCGPVGAEPVETKEDRESEREAKELIRAEKRGKHKRGDRAEADGLPAWAKYLGLGVLVVIGLALAVFVGVLMRQPISVSRVRHAIGGGGGGGGGGGE